MAKVIVWNLMTLEGFFEGKEKWDLAFHADAWGDELAELSSEFGQKAGLIDEIMIAVAPVTIGQGTPLFKASPDKRSFALIAARPLKNGTVILHYGVKAAA